MIPPDDSPLTQWVVRDVVMVAMCAVLCTGCIAAGWYGASGTPRTATQYGWVNLGASGVIVLGAGNVAWLLAGRRRLGRYQQAVLRILATDSPAGPAGSATPVRDDDASRVAIANGSYYHLPSCHLVLGKEVTAEAAATHESRRRRPCGACQP